jgi:hypothetical protein
MSQYPSVYAMGSQRAYIVLPGELIEEIDSLVGPQGRSAFLAETRGLS